MSEKRKKAKLFDIRHFPMDCARLTLMLLPLVYPVRAFTPTGEKYRRILRGGAIIAAVGYGAWGSVSEAAETLVKRVKTYEPTDKLRSELLERFEIYRGLYPALRESFETWKEIQS